LKKGFFIFVTALALLLLVRALHTNRRSEWSFGDAQTVLAVDNWRHVGFRATYFLWIPQAYSAVTRYLDDVPLSHHAHGVAVGGRHYRAYTHYPGWYAVPYGFLAQLGITSAAGFRVFALAISLLSVVFLFRFIATELGEPFAAVASAIYLLHESFLGYCDSLANFPYDDLFKFWFFWRWGKSGKSSPLLTCAIFFLLCITSFDSPFAIPIYVIVYDRLLRQKFQWGRYILLGATGLSAMAFLLTQNALYFGNYPTAFLDWFGQFHSQSDVARGPLQQLLSIASAIQAIVVRDFRMGWLSWIFIALWAQTVWEKRDKKNLGLGLALFFSGLAYAYVFPVRVGGQRYVHRMLTPFLALVWTTLLRDRLWVYFKNRKKIPAALFGALFALCFYHTHLRALPTFWDLPPRDRIKPEISQALQRLGALSPDDKIYFEMTHFLEHHGPTTQIAPLIEEAARVPILFANNPGDAARDLNLLWQRAADPFRVYFLFPREYSIDEKGIENAFAASGHSVRVSLLPPDAIFRFAEIVRTDR
jgi:hypothetical protein